MSEPRLVIVSNRVPPPPSVGKPWPAGGLVSALLPALHQRGNAVWFGWSGATEKPSDALHHLRWDGIDYVTLDLAAQQVEQYYDGFCNRVLWPALHGFAKPSDSQPPFFEAYRDVNRLFAASLMPLLRPGDIVWAHDYHLVLLGSELRRAGWRGALGYFHHTPLPVHEEWSRIPHADLLAGSLGAYDLLGVQTTQDAIRLSSIVGSGTTSQIGVYPAGIDPDRFRALARRHAPPEHNDAVDDRQVMIGVDRLDYTKGILERLLAFERLLAADPTIADKVHFVQWAAPSRSDVPEYQSYRAQVEAAARRINARFPQRKPVTLDVTSHPPDEVAPALRSADICVVTSLADGMNLVAKEYAAVHSAAEPGVLILSDTCGASEQLSGALTVSSTDVDSIANAMRRAIEMPRAERGRRSRRLRDIVDTSTTHDWMRRFVAELTASAWHGASRRRRRLPVAS